MKHVQVWEMTVGCICGCGALTQIPWYGFLNAHIDDERVEFFFGNKWLHRGFRLMRFLKRQRKQTRSLLVMIQTTDGRRFQCDPPVPMDADNNGLHTTVPTVCRELARAGV